MLKITILPLNDPKNRGFQRKFDTFGRKFSDKKKIFSTFFRQPKIYSPCPASTLFLPTFKEEGSKRSGPLIRSRYSPWLPVARTRGDPVPSISIFGVKIDVTDTGKQLKLLPTNLIFQGYGAPNSTSACGPRPSLGAHIAPTILPMALKFSSKKRVSRRRKGERRKKAKRGKRRELAQITFLATPLVVAPVAGWLIVASRRSISLPYCRLSRAIHVHKQSVGTDYGLIAVTALSRSKSVRFNQWVKQPDLLMLSAGLRHWGAISPNILCYRSGVAGSNCSGALEGWGMGRGVHSPRGLGKGSVEGRAPSSENFRIFLCENDVLWCIFGTILSNWVGS